jgi:hypothetical protein
MSMAMKAGESAMARFPRKIAVNVRGHAKLGHDLVDRRDRIAGRAGRRQIKHMVEARPW